MILASSNNSSSVQFSKVGKLRSLLCRGITLLKDIQRVIYVFDRYIFKQQWKFILNQKL